MAVVTTQRLTGRITSSLSLTGQMTSGETRLLGKVKIILSGSNNIIQLQQAEYDALTEKIPNVYYFITG